MSGRYVYMRDHIGTGLIINNRFLLQNQIKSDKTKLTQYFGRDLAKGNQIIVKFEPHGSDFSALEKDALIFNYLKARRLESGIPDILYFSTKEVVGYTVLVSELLSSSLEKLLRDSYNGRFTLKTVLMLGLQMVDRIEYLHKHHQIHRNISPMNFLMGRGDQRSIVFLNNYGLTLEYEPVNEFGHRMHIPYKENNHFYGNPIFSSLRALRGREMSRRDDIEAIGFILVYLLEGRLPWSKMPFKFNKEQCQQAIIKMREKYTPRDLCRNLPTEFTIFLEYAQSLAFKQEPAYGFLRNLLRNLLKARGFENDRIFEWTGQMIEKDQWDSRYTRKRKLKRSRSDESYESYDQISEKRVKRESRDERDRAHCSYYVDGHYTKSRGYTRKWEGYTSSEEDEDDQRLLIKRKMTSSREELIKRERRESSSREAREGRESTSSREERKVMVKTEKKPQQDVLKPKGKKATNKSIKKPPIPDPKSIISTVGNEIKTDSDSVAVKVKPEKSYTSISSISSISSAQIPQCVQKSTNSVGAPLTENKPPAPINQDLSDKSENVNESNVNLETKTVIPCIYEEVDGPDLSWLEEDDWDED